MATTVIRTKPIGTYDFDDFDESKNYHRILFRPGFSVQARELTQMQTALQAQIDRYGQFAFKDGSRVVNGKATVNVEYDFVKLTSTDANLEEFVGTTVSGGTTGISAEVLQAVKAVGGDEDTLYVRYKDSGTTATVNGSTNNSATATLSAANANIKVGQKVTGAGITTTVTVSNIIGSIITLSSAQTLADGAVLTFTGTNSVFSNGETISNSAGKSATLVSSGATGFGSTVNIEEGVYFISGTFVFVPAGSLILDKYTNTPNYIVGLKVTESEVTSGTDTSLLDNAQGVPNTAAPGANRYQISTTLIKEPLSLASRVEKRYITLLQIENGKVAVDSNFMSKFN